MNPNLLRTSTSTGHFTSLYPHLPEDGGTGGDQGGGGGAATGAPEVKPKPEAPAATTGDEVVVGPNGYPLDTAPEQMKPEHQAAYWRTLSRKQEGRAKESYEWRKANEDKVTQFTALQEASRTEAEKAIAKATEDGKKLGREGALTEARTTYGAQLVQSRLDGAASAKGMTPDALKTLAGDPVRFLNDDGVDADALTAFLNALPDAKKVVAPAGLGAGKRTPVATTSGADLYAQRHPVRK